MTPHATAGSPDASTEERHGERHGDRPTDRLTDRPTDRAMFWIHLATLVLAGVVLLWFGRNQWFGSDEWDPIARRAVFGGGELGLLAPHNEHWSTFGVLLYRAHLAIFGLRSYFPLMVVFVGSHLLVAHLLWRVMRRAGADTIVATALAAVFALLGSAGVEMLYAWNVTFSGAVACGLGALLVMSPRAGWSRRDGVVGALLVASLMFSGVGITMIVVAVLFAWWSRGWRDGLRVASVPTVVYGIWIFGWGRTGVNSGIRTDAIRNLLEVLWKAITFVFELTTGWGLLGAVIVLVALVAFVALDRTVWRRPAILAVTCAVGAPLFFVLTSLRRYGTFGDDWVKFPRYSYVAFALLLPLVALAVSRVFARRLPQVLVLLVVVVLLLGHQVLTLDQAEARGARTDQEVRAHVVAVAALLREGAPRVTDHPLAYCCDDLDVVTIRQLDRDGQLPEVTASARARNAARTHLQVAVVAGAHGPRGTAPTLTAIDDALIAAGPGECAETSTSHPRPIVRFDVTGRTDIVVSAPDGGLLALWLVPTSDRRTDGVPPTTFVPGGTSLQAALTAGQPSTIRIAAAGRLLVRLPDDATVRFCDATPG